jgi:hypothetical protein
MSAALARSRVDLAEAIRLDESYADAWCFSGILGLRAGDAETEVRERLARCLEAQPPSEVRLLVEDVIASLDR